MQIVWSFQAILLHYTESYLTKIYTFLEDKAPHNISVSHIKYGYYCSHLASHASTMLSLPNVDW